MQIAKNKTRIKSVRLTARMLPKRSAVVNDVVIPSVMLIKRPVKETPRLMMMAIDSSL
jgi:hypothetical protein